MFAFGFAFAFASEPCLGLGPSQGLHRGFAGASQGLHRGFTGASQGLSRPCNAFPGRLTRDSRNRRFTRDTFRTSPKIYMDFSDIFSGFSQTFPGFFLGLKNHFFTNFSR